MTAAATLGGIPGQLILCDTLTVDFHYGDPIDANGVSFSGRSLRLVGTSATDDVTMTASEITVNGSAPLYYANVSDFAFDLGAGDNALALDHSTIILQKDNAISAGTTVTVDGGVLNFNGHADQIGDLIVKNNGQVLGGSIRNGTTTVSSGILAVSSIVCDSLIIGTAPGITTDAVDPNSAKDAILQDAEPLRLITPTFVEKTAIASTPDGSKTIFGQPIMEQVDENAACSITNSPNDEASTIAVVPGSVISDPSMLTDDVDRAVTSILIGSTAEVKQLPVGKTTQFDDRYSFFRPNPLTRRIIDSVYGESTVSPARQKRQPSIVLNPSQNARSLALQSLADEYRQSATIEQEETEMFTVKYFRKQEKLAQVAVDEFHADLFGAID
jgi:hypothetical protein